MVRNLNVVFLKDKTIEDRQQHKSKSTSQSTPIIADSSLVEPTLSAIRRHPVGTTESESVNSEQQTYESESELADLLKSIEEYDLESAGTQQPIDMHEPKTREELGGPSEPKPTMGGRRYSLRERRAPTTYTSQYILLTDDGEPECYDEAIVDKHKEKWLSAMQD